MSGAAAEEGGGVPRRAVGCRGLWRVGSPGGGKPCAVHTHQPLGEGLLGGACSYHSWAGEGGLCTNVLLPSLGRGRARITAARPSLCFRAPRDLYRDMLSGLRPPAHQTLATLGGLVGGVHTCGVGTRQDRGGWCVGPNRRRATRGLVGEWPAPPACWADQIRSQDAGLGHACQGSAACQAASCRSSALLRVLRPVRAFCPCSTEDSTHG